MSIRSAKDLTSFRWATVTSTSPLRVKLDGDSADLLLTPDTLVDPESLSVGTRVRVELTQRKVVVHGVSGGAGAGIPPGIIQYTASPSTPEGWLLCDGQAVSRTIYASLFAAIGTIYGAGNGSTTFNLPNLKGRVLVHRDSSQTEFNVLGETGGEKEHTLTIDEMPSHTHVQNAHTHGGSNGNSAFIGGGGGTNANAVGSGGYAIKNVGSTTATNQNTGGGGPHNNLQPYIVLNAIIKI